MAEIKVGGTLVTALLDNKLAYTDQLFDKQRNEFQEEINADIYRKLNSVGDGSGSGGNVNVEDYIIDSLDSTSTHMALSANKGRELNEKLNDKLSTTDLNNALANYDTSTEVDAKINGSLTDYDTSSEVDTKISNAITNIGAGNVNTSDTLTSDYIIVGNGNKSVKVSNISIDSINSGGGSINITDHIVDNLNSTDTNKALSANQGRILNEALNDKLSSSDLNGYATIDDVDQKISDTITNIGAGNVNADSNFTTNGNIVVTVSGDKKIKQSDINTENLITLFNIYDYAPSRDIINELDNNVVRATSEYDWSQGYIVASWPSSQKLAYTWRPINDIITTDKIQNDYINNNTLATPDSVRNIIKTEYIDKGIFATRDQITAIYSEIESSNQAIGVLSEEISNINTSLESKGNVSTNSNELTTGYIIVGDGNKNIAVSTISLETLQNTGSNLTVATADALGGIQIGYTSENKNYLPVKLDNNKAFIEITKESITTVLAKDDITTILGYTPADSNNLTIPETLPNPELLSISVKLKESTGPSDTSTINTSYNGESPVDVLIDLSKFYKRLESTTTIGAPGIYFIAAENHIATTYNLTEVLLTEQEPNALIIIPANSTVNCSHDYKLANNIDAVTGTASQYKCYSLTYIAQTQIQEDVVLVNCAIYGL